MIATLKRAEAAERGAMLRDAGILRATERQVQVGQDKLLRTELRVLDVLLANGCVSADDIVDDLAASHPDGGRWRGGIFMRLARMGLTTRLGWKHSNRSARHRGWQTVWGIADREAVEKRRREVQAMLDALTTINALTTNETGSAGAAVEPVMYSNTNPSTKGLTENG
jgi:hypothetical protein